MSILPKNEPMERDITPKVYFIWGQSMHGKTYLAKQFPNPIILNTDGNGKKITTPHVEIGDFETFVAVIKELETSKHTYETVVIDLVDDIKTFLEIFVCKKHDVENLADAPFGRAFGDVKSTWKKLMIRLTQMPLNVIFISHIVQVVDEYDSNKTIDQPSLEQKYLNMTKGRTDVMIRCQKVGKTYLQICNERREKYVKADFKDERLLDILSDVKQLFDDNKPGIQPMKKTETKETKSEKPVAKMRKSKPVKEVSEDVPEEVEVPKEVPKAKMRKSTKKVEKKVEPSEIVEMTAEALLGKPTKKTKKQEVEDTKEESKETIKPKAKKSLLVKKEEE